MHCAKCGAENREGRKFCAQCGFTLAAKCPRCGASNEAGEKFCGDCGTPLATPSAAASKKSEDRQIRVAETAAPEKLEGERKTVTALFADIKGSTELEQDLDPEEARAIVDPALKLMIDAVRHYDGHVVQSTGDGIFAIFGAPIAHEDHPQRALYATIRMHDEIRRYADRLRAEGRAPLQIRVGADTGEVVMRSIVTGTGHIEYTPIGHPANLASRMQSLANPGSTVVSEATRKLIEGYFALKSLGASRVKGISEPVNVYEVTGLGPLRTRLQRSASRGYSKFVGREREMDAMRTAAEQARAGHGQIVAAMAEAGVGKSRLLFEFKAKNQSGWMVLETLSVSYGKASAYLPVIDLLYGYFRIATEDDARTRREKVAGKVAILDRALEDTLPYLFGLLGIVEGDDPLAQMDAQIKKRRTLEAIKRILLRESLNQPLMVEFEDLHWIDEQTQEFLNLLADSIGTAKILLLVNYRPEYSHQWNSKTYYTQLRLDPLGRESAEELLSSRLGDGKDLIPLRRLIIAKTEGNPFFMEEMVQVLLDEGALVRDGTVIKITKSLSQLKIPSTVQGILASRIDRLQPDAKDLLQMLAVIGREFPMSLIRAVVTKSDDELNRGLNDLQLGEFIYEQPAMGDLEYTFKHALTQEVAYSLVLTERRKPLHERAGEAIETLFAERLDEHLNELARHYGRSANTVKAVKYLYLAGQQAAQRSAYVEAVGHISDGLALLNGLSDDPARARQELNLQIALAESLRWTKGVGAPEIGGALVRAHEICRQLGEDTPFAVLLGLQSHYQRSSQPETARNLREQILALAESANEPSKLAAAHSAMGITLLQSGELAAAREHFEQAGPRLDREDSFLGASAFYACAGAWALWTLGYADQALKWSGEALASAEALSRPATLANALGITAQLHVFLRDPRMAQERAAAASAIATELGFPHELANGTTALGWALAEQGHLEEGIAEMRRAFTAAKATGFSARVRWFAFLAEACAKIEGPDSGLRVLAEGTALMESSGERMYEAELHRVKGELLLMQGSGNNAEAEICFHTAIEVAHRQGGKSLELRATMSLARLLAKHGKRDEARAMLADIYNWFTEGFDTADLKDAKALLEELNE